MAATVAIACGAVGIELELCRQGTEAWAAHTGHKVRIISTPNDAKERLALFQQLLAARSPDIDVFQIDVVWPGILAPYLLDLRPHVTAEETVRHSQALIANNSVNGRLVALPWFADAGVLYFRRDLLAKYGAAVPDTWQQLTEIARKIQDGERARGRARMWGYVWQGRAYEGLTCNALEGIHSAGGGAIVDPTGRVTVDNAKAAAALTLAASWIGSITPPGVLNYAEEEARGVFQAGDAVFMRNWPYAFALANQPESAVAGRIGSRCQGGDDAPSSATLGGSQLAVSRYSRAPEVAVELLRALTSVAEQRRAQSRRAFIRPSDSSTRTMSFWQRGRCSASCGRSSLAQSPGLPRWSGGATIKSRTSSGMPSMMS
jgi:trehalose/maltose transport system substrate-binding protein